MLHDGAGGVGIIERVTEAARPTPSGRPAAGPRSSLRVPCRTL